MTFPIFKAMLAGAIMVCAWAIAMFFVRFWRKTSDPLFGLFAVAFLLLGLERISMVAFIHEAHSFVYLIRLSAFLLILYAIVGKNRRRQKP